MSYHTFFSMSSGLSGPLKVPKGTLESIMKHVKSVEETLGFQIHEYNGVKYQWMQHTMKEVSDKVLCEIAEDHNRRIRYLYEQLGEWSQKPPAEFEVITPEDAQQFWYSLHDITVPPERWTREYYVARMESLYEVMRGRESEGVTFGEKPLTERQAAQVINLFSAFLDGNDCRLDVPKGHDYLASSYDGGYVWCEKCGAVTDDHMDSCRKRGCPRKENGFD